MTSSQKKRVFLVAALAVISAVVVAPTFFQDQLPDEWPSSAIRLGLDLRGGTYLVMSVKTQEAVQSQLNSMAGSIRMDLRQERIGFRRAKRKGSDLLEVTFHKDRGLKRLEEYVGENYPELIKVDEQKTGARVTVTYRINEMRVVEIEKNAVEQAIEVIRNRIDQYGVTEPVIQRSGEKRIIVQVPESKKYNKQQIIDLIGVTAQLEFRLVADVARPADETIELLDEAKIPVSSGRRRADDRGCR